MALGTSDHQGGRDDPDRESRIATDGHAHHNRNNNDRLVDVPRTLSGLGNARSEVSTETDTAANDLKVRQLAQNLLQDFAQQTRTREQLLRLSAELPQEGSNIQHNRRFLSESATALVKAVGSAATQDSARQTLQQFQEDLERTVTGLDVRDRLRDEYKDLLYRTLSADENLEAVLKDLAIYLNIPVPPGGTAKGHAHEATKGSEASDSSHVPPLLQAYYEKAQQSTFAREYWMDVRSEHEEQRVEREFLADQGRTLAVTDREFEHEFEQRTSEAFGRLTAAERETEEARRQCSAAGIDVPDEDQSSDAESSASSDVEATQDPSAVKQAEASRAARAANVGSWLQTIKPQAAAQDIDISESPVETSLHSKGKRATNIASAVEVSDSIAGRSNRSTTSGRGAPARMETGSNRDLVHHVVAPSTGSRGPTTDSFTIPWQYSASLGGHYLYSSSTDELIINAEGSIRHVPRPPTLRPETLSHAIYEDNRQAESYANHSTAAGPSRGTASTPRSPPRPRSGETSIEALRTQMRSLAVESRTGDHGEKVIVSYNKETQVQNRIQVSPPEDITDPSLLRPDRASQGKLLETPGDAELLKASYRRRVGPREFFKVGKVFMVLWAEPAGGDASSVLTSKTTVGRYGELVYSSVRRFVVIRAGETYCSALPITTYGGRGVSKPNTKKSEHAIIYTGRQPPLALPEERPTRKDPTSLQPRAIRIDTDNREDRLDPVARVNFGAVTTIQHNVKVKSYGIVNRNSMQDLLSQFSGVWNRAQTMTPTPTPPMAGPSVKSGAAAMRALDPNRIKAAINALVAQGYSADDARDKIQAVLLQNVAAASRSGSGTKSSRSSAVMHRDSDQSRDKNSDHNGDSDDDDDDEDNDDDSGNGDECEEENQEEDEDEESTENEDGDEYEDVEHEDLHGEERKDVDAILEGPDNDVDEVPSYLRP